MAQLFLDFDVIKKKLICQCDFNGPYEAIRPSGGPRGHCPPLPLPPPPPPRPFGGIGAR